MSTINLYDAIWKTLRENTFTVDELAHAEYICVLCKKILIEAKQAQCACKFCTKCIEEYLSQGNSICPGNTSECNDEILQMNENISNDYVTNRRISKLKLKCPSKNCIYEDILSNIDKHLMMCGKPTVACPFSQFGCNQVLVDKDEIVKHLKLENYEHSNLMIDMIENLKNEVEILKKENVLFKSNSDKQQTLIENLELEVHEIKEFNADYALGTSDSNAEYDFDDFYNWPFFTGMSSFNYEDCQQRDDSDESEDSDEIDETVDNQLKYKEFSWIISGFKKKQLMKSFDSDAFYTHENGYRIQLRLLPACRRTAGWYGISIYPNCIKGDYDSYLQWPLKCEITIGVINQRTELRVNQITRLVSYESPNKSYISPFELALNDDLSLYENSLKIECTLKIIE